MQYPKCKLNIKEHKELRNIDDIVTIHYANDKLAAEKGNQPGRILKSYNKVFFQKCLLCVCN